MTKIPWFHGTTGILPNTTSAINFIDHVLKSDGYMEMKHDLLHVLLCVMFRPLSCQ